MLQAFYFCNKATTIISTQHRRPCETARHTDKTYRMALV
nr:MAG TPA_asm: hypothetical protein [Caudoviricetes sp.]